MKIIELLIVFWIEDANSQSQISKLKNGNWVENAVSLFCRIYQLAYFLISFSCFYEIKCISSRYISETSFFKYFGNGEMDSWTWYYFSFSGKIICTLKRLMRSVLFITYHTLQMIMRIFQLFHFLIKAENPSFFLNKN